jgi:nitroreductase
MRRTETGREQSEFFGIVSRRHSIRAFVARPVEDWKVHLILNTANRAPSAGNLQSYEIFVIVGKQKKVQLAEAAYGQEFIAQAPLVLVFAADPSRSALKYGSRGEELYCIQDATIAAAYAQLSATSLDLGSVWVGAFDERRALKVLDEKNLRPLVIMPIGYAAESPEPTDRRKLEDTVHFLV